ncbi:MAG: lipopolysaccharide kinase InaA family protein [Thermodesulfobacteriota bacterium]
MGIAEKKPDTLSSVYGERARKYRQEIEVLLQGRLPEGWQWVASSKDTVVAATATEPFVFYKEFLPRSPFEKIKSLVRGSRCQRARQQSAMLKAAGLESPAVLCWGRGRRNDFLLTAGFAGSGFFQFLKSHFSGSLSSDQLLRKRRLLQEAGSLIGKLHSAGISHGDLRQDNLLVREEKEGFVFCFIDNESNKMWRQVPMANIIINLIQFSICSGHVLTRSDLLRLFNSYGQEYPRFHHGVERRKLFTKVMGRSRQRILYYNVKDDLSGAVRIDSSQGTGWYDGQTVLGQQIEAGVDLSHWFRQGEFCKDDKEIQVKVLSCPDGMVVAKRFLGRGVLSLLKAWFRLERAPRLWQMSSIFQALEIPIAPPLGYLLAGCGPWRRESYFFSDYAGGKRDLLTISKERPELISRLCREKFFSRIAFYLSRLHNNGYCHGDTKWANIMVDEERGDLLFIDLDGAGQVKAPLGRAIVKDVSRFVVDMLEHGLAAAEVRQFVKEYSNMRVLDGAFVQKKITPHIKKALARHGRPDIDVLGIWEA